MMINGNTILSAENLTLVTDLSSGFSKEQAKELGFEVANFPVTIYHEDQGVAFLEGNETNEAFYACLANPDTTGAKTGSSVDSFLGIFERNLRQNKLVVYLGITDSLSAGMRNAALTAQSMIRDEHPDLNADSILVLQTHCVAGGLGLALRMLREWLDAEPRTVDELKQKVEYLGDHMAHLFTLYSYDYMKKSGRFASTAESLKISLAKTMHIYPVMLSPRNGPLQPTWKKVRGTQNLLKTFVDIYAETAVNPETGEVEIDYSGTTDSNSTAYTQAEELRKMLHEKFPKVKIRTGQTSPSVGCHVGPDEMSFFFLQKEVRPDM